jgi:hypothetical protein
MKTIVNVSWQAIAALYPLPPRPAPDPVIAHPPRHCDCHVTLLLAMTTSAEMFAPISIQNSLEGQLLAA